MWAKASISPLSELAREAGEAQSAGEADRPHIHRLPRKLAAVWSTRGKSGTGSGRLHLEGLLFRSRASGRGRDLRGTRCHYCRIGVDDAWSLGSILVGRDRPAVHHGRRADGNGEGRPDTEDLQAADFRVVSAGRGVAEPLPVPAI